jgi:Leucine-rich repeat (LRR) protein
VQELRLEYNKLVTLSGALAGLIGLKKLNISHNCIDRILSDDLIGLDDLKILDISFNQLTTLSETFKVKHLSLLY